MSGKASQNASLRSGLLTWKDILPWQRDNEFILTGYRPASFSYLKSLTSILQIHNETVNIWSHILATALFLWLLQSFLRITAAIQDLPLQDTLALTLYYLSVVACFLSSAVFHTLSDHSAPVHKFANELDHLGIVFVLWGSGVSLVHFEFYCHHALRDVYFAFLTLTALACGLFTLRPKFRQPTYRTTRFFMHVFLGASLFAPIAHGLWRVGWEEMELTMGLRSFLGLAAIQLSGGVFYALRIPERWYPGTFDLIGHSHNWLHVVVVFGALVRLSGLLEVVARWQGELSCPSI